jgi:hypothetical protein
MSKNMSRKVITSANRLLDNTIGVAVWHLINMEARKDRVAYKAECVRLLVELERRGKFATRKGLARRLKWSCAIDAMASLIGRMS